MITRRTSLTSAAGIAARPGFRQKVGLALYSDHYEAATNLPECCAPWKLQA